MVKKLECTIVRGCKNKALVFNIEEKHRVFACKLHREKLSICSEIIDMAPTITKLPKNSIEKLPEWKDLLYKRIALIILHNYKLARDFDYCDFTHIKLAWDYLSYLTSGFPQTSTDGFILNYKIPHISILKTKVNVDGIKIDMTKSIKVIQTVITDFMFSDYFLTRCLGLIRKLLSNKNNKKQKLKDMAIYVQPINWLMNRMTNLMRSDHTFDIKKVVVSMFDGAIGPTKIPNSLDHNGDIIENARLSFRMGEYESAMGCYKITIDSEIRTEKFESILYIGIIRFIYGYYQASISILKFCKKCRILEYEGLSRKYIAYNYAKMKDCKNAALWLKKAKFYKLDCLDVENYLLFAQGDYKLIMDHSNFKHFYEKFNHVYHIRTLCPFIADFYTENLMLIANCSKHYSGHANIWNKLNGDHLFSRYCPENAPVKCELLENRALYKLFFNNLEDALREIIQAKDMCEKIYERNHSRTISVLCNMGSIYLKRKSNVEASMIFEDVLARLQNKQITDFAVLIAIGKYYRSIKQLETAFQYFSDAINLTKENRTDHPNIAIALVCIGKLYAKIKDKKAIKYYKKAREIFEKQSMEIDIGYTSICLYKIYRDLGKNEKSLRLLSIASETLKEDFREKLSKILNN